MSVGLAGSRWFDMDGGRCLRLLLIVLLIAAFGSLVLAVAEDARGCKGLDHCG